MADSPRWADIFGIAPGLRTLDSDLEDRLAEAERRAERYRLAWLSAARRARTARTRGLVDAENAIREEARASGQQLNRLVLGLAARLVADLQEKP